MLKLSDENNKVEKKIYDYLEDYKEKDECFKNKIEEKDFQTKDLVLYCCSEAKKQCKGTSICFDDEDVYEWCIHFILEGIKATDIKPVHAPVKVSNNTTKVDNVKPKVEVKPKEKKKEDTGQLSIFDFGVELNE